MLRSANTDNSHITCLAHWVIQIQSEEIFSPSKHPSVVQPQHLQCHKLPLPHCGWSRRNRRGCRDCQWGWPWCINYCYYFENIFAPIEMDSITANSNFTCEPDIKCYLCTTQGSTVTKSSSSVPSAIACSPDIMICVQDISTWQDIYTFMKNILFI